MASQNSDDGTQALQPLDEKTSALTRTRDSALARALERGPFAFMQQLFDDLEQTWAASVPGRLREVVELPFVPQVEVSHHDDRLVIDCDVPGLSADDIEVSIEENALVITGERRNEYEGEEAHRTWRSERMYGMFRRVVPLPEGAELDSAQASFTDGVLEVSIRAPRPSGQRRTIDVRTGETR